MTGPCGKFFRPTTRWVKRQVKRSHPKMNSIQNVAQATTARRGSKRMGEPTSAMTTLPAYQPTLKQSERSQRERPVMLVAPVLVA